MKLEIDLPDYIPGNDLQMEWENNFEIVTEIVNGTTIITANRAGLISLARLLLTLADPAVPGGSHWHLDAAPYELEPGSTELIIVNGEPRT